MNCVNIRGTVIGEGIPKICVPIVETTTKDILARAAAIRKLPVDVVEWRIDWFASVFDEEKLLEALKGLRNVLGEMPLLVTFRTQREGGEKSIDPETYAKLNILIAGTGLADLIDVELFTGDAIVSAIIRKAHEAGTYVVASNHDFSSTPAKEEIVRRLIRMQEMGADIPKIAVMPRSKADLLTLLSATEEMAAQYADRPIITMSMAGNGILSRLCGEVFGSALTFGAATKASAPGQIEAKDLHTMLQLLHKCISETSREPITSGSAKQDGNEIEHPTDFVRYKHAFIEEVF